jgi:uncharacterized coiled-coil protein SlyX
MDAMDKALTLARNYLTRVPTELDRRITGLKELIAHQNDTVAEKIGQQYVLLNAVEKSLNEKYTELAGRLTRIESSGEGRGQISGPLWGIAAAVLTALLAAGLITIMEKPHQEMVPIIERQIGTIQQNQSPEVLRQRLQEIGK